MNITTITTQQKFKKRGLSKLGSTQLNCLDFGCLSLPTDIHIYISVHSELLHLLKPLCTGIHSKSNTLVLCHMNVFGASISYDEYIRIPCGITRF